jgi:hypothetical protein
MGVAPYPRRAARRATADPERRRFARLDGSKPVIRQAREGDGRPRVEVGA